MGAEAGCGQGAAFFFTRHGAGQAQAFLSKNFFISHQEIFRCADINETPFSKGTIFEKRGIKKYFAYFFDKQEGIF